MVNVDVYVTDKKGRPITGLTREDFVLYEDGREVEITNFSRLTGAVESRSASSESGAEPTAGAEEELPGTPIGDELVVVIYIDNSSLIQAHRNRVLGNIKDFTAREMARGTRFMVAAYDPGLEILAPLTSDLATIEAALDQVAAMPANGLFALTEKRVAADSVEQIFRMYAEAKGPGRDAATAPAGVGVRSRRYDPCEFGWGQLLGVVDGYAQAIGSRISKAQSGLTSLARSLGGIPGRKSVLYLSDGFEQQPGADLYDYLGGLCADRERELFAHSNRWDGTPGILELTAFANAHRVTFYPLETAGLKSDSNSSVELASKKFAPLARNDFLKVSNLQSSMFMMANETGGQAFFDANFPDEELERVSQDFTDYYSLGFQPTFGWDGETHFLHVELVDKAGRGARLRHRRRYAAVPEEERMAESTLATLVLGQERNELGTELRVGDQTALETGVWQVPLTISVPLETLASLSESLDRKQLLRVLIMAEDGQSRRTPMRERLIPIDASHTAGSDVHEVVVTVSLEAGTHLIAVGVRDELSRLTSYHRAEIVVAEPGDGDSGT